jgi:hypothetical protein
VNLQAVSALLAAALTGATCYAAGALLIARLGVSLRRAERFPLAFVLGAACVHLAMFAIFAMKIAYKPVFLVLSGGLIAAAAVAHRNSVHNRARQARAGESIGVARKTNAETDFSWRNNLPAFGYAAIFAIFTVLYFVNAWAPEWSSDGSGYHLGLIARYLRAHGFERVTTNMYAGLGEGAEMLYALAFAFGRNSAAALVHFSFAIALALAMLAYGLRIGKWWVGAGAALLVYVSPVVGKDASSAYVDLAAAAIAFSVFYWLEIWDDGAGAGGGQEEWTFHTPHSTTTGGRNNRALIPVGLLAGYAYATKYTGGVIVLYALAFVAWRTWRHDGKQGRERVRPLLVIGACAAAMMLPWMVKDWIYLGDPIAPFGASIFRNPNVHVSTIVEWSEKMRSYNMPNKWKLPLELTIHGGFTQGILGPVFLAAPLGLLALRYRAGRRLLLAGGVLLITYFANIGTRFLIPCLPFVAMAMTLAVGNMPRIVAALVFFHAVASWPTVLPSYANQYLWRIEQFPLQAALRRQSEDSFLRQSLDSYPKTRMIQDHVPPGERVLTMTGVADSYTTREILVGFEGAFNQLVFDSVNIGWNDAYRPRVAVVFQFPERTLRRIRILQTAHGKPHEQWNVQEVRYLRGGVELLRSPEWRLRAWPNSWDVQLAFDNSPATRWRSWETPAPGMYIETDFGADRTVDQVVVETSTEGMWSVTMQVQMMDGSGRWVKLAANPEIREIPVPLWLRRAATYELHARGVNYMLVDDGAYGAGDYFDDPDTWGLQIVAREGDVTLYKVVP